MIKISEFEKQAIIQRAFMDELEKLGGIGSLLMKSLPFLKRLGKYGKGLKNAYQTGGTEQAVQFAKQFTSPRIVTTGKNTVKVLETRNPSDMTGALQKSIGNSIRSFKNTFSGVSTDKSFLDNTKEVFKGLGREAKQQLGSSRYRLVDREKLNPDKTFGSTFKRKPVGYTKNKKQAIIKKRLPMQAAAMTATPAGFGGLAALTASDSGFPDKRITEGAGEFAKWTFLRPYAGAELAKDFISML